MGIYSNSKRLYTESVEDTDFDISTAEPLSEAELEAVTNFLVECMVNEAIDNLDEDAAREYICSEEYDILCETKKFKKKTIVKLNQKDDLSRRQTQAAIIIAQQKDDPLARKLTANRVKERELLDQIERKYATQALKAAKNAQRDYVKDVNKSKVLSTSDLQKTRRVAE